MQFFKDLKGWVQSLFMVSQSFLLVEKTSMTGLEAIYAHFQPNELVANFQIGNGLLEK